MRVCSRNGCAKELSGRQQVYCSRSCKASAPGFTFKNHSHSLETLTQMSSSHSGVALSPDHVRKAADGRRGMKLALTIRQAFSEVQKLNWNGVTPALGSKKSGNRISEITFWRMVVDQEHCCWMCKKSLLEGGPIVVDHDHETKEIRGIAHSICNFNYENPNHIKHREELMCQ